MNEPRTEAGRALNRAAWAPNGMREAILAIEEQAATEARRELLAKVEGLPLSYGTQFPASPLVYRDAVRRLIEEADHD